MDVEGIHFHCISTGPLCDITIVFSPAYPALQAREARGKIARTEDDKLRITYEKASMPQSMKDFFSNGVMTMPANKVIPLDVTSELGFDTEYTIMQGSYDYTEDDNYFYVVF